LGSPFDQFWTLWVTVKDLGAATGSAQGIVPTSGGVWEAPSAPATVQLTPVLREFQVASASFQDSASWYTRGQAVPSFSSSRVSVAVTMSEP
jgi:hypothetical protein